jgi:type II secretory pathway component PulM
MKGCFRYSFQPKKRIVTFGQTIAGMFKRLKEFYRQYRPYVRVDLVMYGVLILLIILYFIISLFLD